MQQVTSSTGRHQVLQQQQGLVDHHEQLTQGLQAPNNRAGKQAEGHHEVLVHEC